MAQIDPPADALVGDWLTLPEAAERLGIPPGRLKQLFRDRKLLAVQRPDGTTAVPAAFVDGGTIIKGLHGTLTVLYDCGFDDPLPGTPVQAMIENRRTEVNRRAQALAF